MSAKKLSLHEAARLLGTTRHALLKSMRDAGHMHGTTPADDLVKAGFFCIEPGSWEVTGGPRRNYMVTRVTLQGLAWLDARINGIPMQKAS